MAHCSNETSESAKLLDSQIADNGAIVKWRGDWEVTEQRTWGLIRQTETHENGTGYDVLEISI